ncbi:helix-turn-helix domain-containing protein [Thermodesulfovibrio yellowstonii]|uniref:helix-turn-helix domain-containing protein n=1 Tax=Thermodesulfovibrio yellowstonii TaxID=28262 RepID=UPI003C79755A
MPNIAFTEEEIKLLAKELTKIILPEIKKAITDDEILTFEQTCEFLKCNRSWLYERVRLKEIPHIKTGRYLKFSKKELLKWLEKHSTGMK